MSKNIDCNDCINLNITEQEQRELKDNKKWHECMEYNSQVIHLSNTKDHNPKLYPCIECKADSYRHYHKR